MIKPWVMVTTGALLFAGGFASGFFFRKKMEDVEFEEVSQEEMNMIEEKVKASEQKEEPQKTDEDLPTDPDKLRNYLQGKVSYIQADKEAKAAYAEVWNTIKDYSDKENADEMPVESTEEGFDPEFLEMLEEEEVEPGQVTPPHPITLADFYNERSEYDKVTVDWYEPDTWVDEKEEIIADLKSYFGDIDMQKLFATTEEDEDPDIRFVRNERYGTDYEVIRHHRTWAETTGTKGGSE